MQEFLNLTESAPLSLPTLIINLILTLLLGSLLTWFYTRYGRSFSNRSKLAQILPIIAVTTALMDDLRTTLPGSEFSFIEQESSLAG